MAIEVILQIMTNNKPGLTLLLAQRQGLFATLSYYLSTNNHPMKDLQ